MGLVGPWHSGIFPYQRLDPRLLHWQVDSLPLNHQGSLISFKAPQVTPVHSQG